MAYVRDYTVNNSETRTFEQSVAAVYRHMYGWMTCGLALTALTSFVLFNYLNHHLDAWSWFFSETGGLGPAMWISMIGSFAIVWILSARVMSMSFSSASLMFALYSCVMGVWITPLLSIYTGESVFQVFLITAGTFGGMAVFGHVTKKDLTGMGRFLIMALWGIIIASIVNIFMHLGWMNFGISVLSVLVFCGLTAYDVQKFKGYILSYEGGADDMVRKIAVLGALSLYMDFLNIFIHLLSILGSRRD